MGESSESSSESKNRTYQRESIKLPKKEYGRVMHSINNLYESKYKGQQRGIIFIGKSKYRFEINDFNEYNIYSKEDEDD